MSAMGATVIISADDLENLGEGAQPYVAARDGLLGARANAASAARKCSCTKVRGHTKGTRWFTCLRSAWSSRATSLPRSKSLPYIVDTAAAANWMDLSNEIDELLKLDFDLMVPGHGPSYKAGCGEDSKSSVGDPRTLPRIESREKTRMRSPGTHERFGWGKEPAPANIPGMMQELPRTGNHRLELG